VVCKKNGKIVIIGGLDPSGHAGVIADGRVFEYFQHPYQIVLTAVTAQSKDHFYGWKPVSLPLFKKELASVEGPVFGVKIGMLATKNHLKVILKWLKEVTPKWLLWDPVFRSSTGGSLFKGKIYPASFHSLLKSVNVFTPNLQEAEFFLGRKIRNISEMKQAVIDLYHLNKQPHRLVLLKGGHLSKKIAPKTLTDLAVFNLQIFALTHPRRKNRRGTGCTLGSAILANLLKGKKPLQAAKHGKKYLLTKHFNAPTF
jgi:hydroxymethylpyrimidine/phosphomethylpyrimidine kinase